MTGRGEGTRHGTVLFVVETGPQLDAVRRVTAHLSRPAELLALDSAAVLPPEEFAVTSHVARPSVGRLRALGSAVRAWAREHPDGVLVIPQDVGLAYRRVVAVGRRSGLPVALLPDGAVSDDKVSQRGLAGGAVPVADQVLRRSGLLAGSHGVMAASRPDLVLSWGPGWDPIYRTRRVGRIADTGNPRADDLGDLPAPVGDRVLVCSQPHWQPSIGGEPTQAAWYAFLERLVGAAPDGEMAVRLHPWERDRLATLPLGGATRRVLTEGTTLLDDLAWSGAVLSWASTTMLEAAGARRPVVSVAVNPAAARLAQGYVFQRDPRMVSVAAGELTDWAAVLTAVAKARAQQVGLADDYLVNVGSAAKACAEALDAFRPGG